MRVFQSLVAVAVTFLTGLAEVSKATSQPLLTTVPDFPITQLRWWNWNDASMQPWQPITLTVPDQDTTQSAYGGSLRRYDVHVAKMFEVSHYYCQQDEAIEGFRWNYEAANGNVYMGRFDISCDLARNIVTAYGVKRTESTEISSSNIQPDRLRRNPYSKDYEIPVLNIDTNAKIRTWRQYVQTVPPFFEEEIRKVINETVPFPTEQVLPHLEGKVTVPILVPREIPNVRWLLERIEEYGLCPDINSNGYGYSFSTGPCVSRPSMRGFDTFSAVAIEHLPQYLLDNSVHIGPKDTFREVQLTRGVTGTFHKSCGPYCASSLTWDYKGVRYSLSARSGQQIFLVRIANSALEAGDRRTYTY